MDNVIRKKIVLFMPLISLSASPSLFSLTTLSFLLWPLVDMFIFSIFPSRKSILNKS